MTEVNDTIYFLDGTGNLIRARVAKVRPDGACQVVVQGWDQPVTLMPQQIVGPLGRMLWRVKRAWARFWR